MLAGFQLLVALVAETPAIILEILKSTPLIIEAIVLAIISLTWKIVEAVANLIRGLWQGIDSVRDWI